MPIGPTNCIGPPAARRTRPGLVERRERRHRKSSRRPRVERLPLLRRAYDHHRDLRTRAPSRGSGPSHRLGSIAHDQHAPVASRIAAPVPGRYHTGDGDPRQRSLSTPPATAKTQIPHYKTTVLILHTATKTNAAVMTHLSSLFETARSRHTAALNPHRPTPLPAQTLPAVSSPEAFRTPALGARRTVSDGRASENP